MSPSDRDVRVLACLERLSEAYRRGDALEIADVAGDDHDVVEELRQLWPIARVAEDLGSGFAENVRSDDTLPSEEPGAAVDRMRPPPKLASIVALPRNFGDYELLEVLGRGGMGVVYRAWQQSLRREVALKMILRAELASEDEVARFRSEAEAAATLDHPNIVTVYEVGTADDRPYFTMQLIEGTSLAESLKGGSLDPHHAATLLSKVCAAIQYAHESGILHRDLKPANIIIDDHGEPHIMDFGLAKRIEGPANLTRTGAILGTPMYMSPEQASGRRAPVTAASDVYSLGTILFEMLTGRPPFIAASALDVVFQVLEQDPPLPRELDPGVDRDLEMVALKCLQKPPDMRYESAAALKADLDAFLVGDSVSARAGTLFHVISRLFRETHHAVILENWGLLWMWHSVALLVLCLVTHVLHVNGVESPGPYMAIWSLGLGAWAGIFWTLRRRAGPVTFVERQVAHIWGGSVIGSSLLFLVEIILELPVLTLSPVLGILSGSVFLSKAGVLSGRFYIQAVALYLTCPLMALFPDFGLIIFGVVSALCFLLPGWKYHRLRTQD